MSLLALALLIAGGASPYAADFTWSHEGTVVPQVFPERYADVDGVLTFRGGPLRTGGSFGVAHVEKKQLSVAWKAQTLEGKAPWYGGAGWTGEPVIVRWKPEVLARMKRVLTIPPESAADFVEVIQGSLDGRIYFLDLKTGKPTRAPIDTGNPIKGSVSLDARGWPLLAVGQGIPGNPKAPIGLRLYDLARDGVAAWFHGLDQKAPVAQWGAFDSSALFNRDTDSVVEGGENGFVYVVKLNSTFDDDGVHINPAVTRYRYARGVAKNGIEDSLAVRGNIAWFADDGGTLQALDLKTLEPLWSASVNDDTDATIVVDTDVDAATNSARAVIYTGNERDLRGPENDDVKVNVRKLDGETGKLLWKRDFECEGKLEPRHEPGVFATPVVGSGDIGDVVIFMLSRCPDFAGGTLIALEKASGKTVWSKHMPSLAWPSPTAFHDQNGKTWLIQADGAGVVHLIDARTGAIASSLKLAGQIESSPAIFGSRIVLAVRGHAIYGLDIE